MVIKWYMVELEEKTVEELDRTAAGLGTSRNHLLQRILEHPQAWEGGIGDIEKEAGAK